VEAEEERRSVVAGDRVAVRGWGRGEGEPFTLFTLATIELVYPD